MVDYGVGSPLVLGKEVYTVHDSGVGTSNVAIATSILACNVHDCGVDSLYRWVLTK